MGGAPGKAGRSAASVGVPGPARRGPRLLTRSPVSLAGPLAASVDDVAEGRVTAPGTGPRQEFPGGSHGGKYQGSGRRKELGLWVRFDPKDARADTAFVSCSASHISSHEEPKRTPNPGTGRPPRLRNRRRAA